VSLRMSWISSDEPMSISAQCRLLGVPRSSFYHKPKRQPRVADELLMQAIDRLFMEEPTFGSRRMCDALQELGYEIKRERTRRLMREMGIEPIYPKPRLSHPGKGHKVYPYLLRGLDINCPNQVWCTDITYIPLGRTHVYLCAVMDWHSRKVLSWQLSNTLDASFCIEALEEALGHYGTPEIFNTDQGAQFTSDAFTRVLKNHGVRISMDGKGRALDNRMIERLWRSVKYDDIYIRAYESMPGLYQGLKRYFEKYNARKHQGIGGSPNACYASKPLKEAA